VLVSVPAFQTSLPCVDQIIECTTKMMRFEAGDNSTMG